MQLLTETWKYEVIVIIPGGKEVASIILKADSAEKAVNKVRTFVMTELEYEHPLSFRVTILD